MNRSLTQCLSDLDNVESGLRRSGLAADLRQYGLGYAANNVEDAVNAIKNAKREVRSKYRQERVADAKRPRAPVAPRLSP